jgi:hypothetical protein
LKRVNRQLREKEDEANESREKVRKLADQTKIYHDQIQKLEVCQIVKFINFFFFCQQLMPKLFKGSF